MIIHDLICIRTIEERDLELLYKWNTPDFRGDFQECQLESLKRIQTDYEEDEFCSSEFQMMMIESEGQPCGLLTLSFYREGLVKLGIVLASEKRRSGIGSKALSIITEYLFQNYPVVRIEADTDVENIASQKTLERAGFEKEGLLRKFRYHHGAYHDSFLYSKIR